MTSVYVIRRDITANRRFEGQNDSRRLSLEPFKFICEAALRTEPCPSVRRLYLCPKFLTRERKGLTPKIMTRLSALRVTGRPFLSGELVTTSQHQPIATLRKVLPGKCSRVVLTNGQLQERNFRLGDLWVISHNKDQLFMSMSSDANF